MVFFGSALLATEFGLGCRKSECVRDFLSTAVAAMLARCWDEMGTMYTHLTNVAEQYQTPFRYPAWSAARRPGSKH